MLSIQQWMGRPSWLLKLVFGVWFVAISVPLTMLAAQHLPLARRAMAGSRVGGVADGTTILHVLAADCECSQAVADYLLGRGPDPAEHEQVWIVGDAGRLRERLEQEGYRTHTASAEEVGEALGVAGAPFLFVYERGGDAVMYAGGYGPRRPVRAADVQVESIVRGVRAGQSRRPYPAYGCIVGADLRRRVDPLRLKYRSKAEKSL